MVVVRDTCGEILLLLFASAMLKMCENGRMQHSSMYSSAANNSKL